MSLNWDKLSIRILCIIIIMLCDYCQPAQGVDYIILSENMGVYMYVAYWIHRGFNLGIIVTALCGPGISARIGAKKLIVTCLSTIVVLLILIPMSQSIGQLIFMRIIQGFACGLCITASMEMFTKTYPPHRINTPVTLTTLILLFSLILSSFIGGHIATFWGWRWTFWSVLPIFTCLVPLAIIAIPKDKKLVKQKIDYIFLFLFSIFLSAAYYVALYGHEEGWNDSLNIVIAFSIAITSFVSIIIHTYNNPSAIFKLNLFTQKNFLLATAMTLATSTTFAIVISGVNGAVLYALKGNFTYMMTGMFFMIGSITLSSYIVGQYFNKKKHLDYTILVGAALISIFALFYSNLTKQITFEQIVIYGTIGTTGIGTLFTACQQLGISKLKKEDILIGKTLIRMMYFSTFAIFICSYKSVSMILQVANYNDMRGDINAYNPQVMNFLKERVSQFGMRNGYDSHNASQTAITSLHNMLKDEAMILSYIQNANAVLIIGFTIITIIIANILYKKLFNTTI